MNFYDVLAAEKWGGGIPTMNFFDLLFAQSIGGGEQWQTYEGTLPATINANGDNMRQYQIYGAAGGVGDKTVNLFNGYFEQGTTAGGIPTESNNRVRSNIITAVVGAFSVDFKNKENFDVAFDFWNGSALVEATSWLSTKNYITPNNATSVRIKIRKSNDAPVTPAEVIDFGMYSGTTAPASFVPFGYEVPIGVSDGTNTTVTPIYIGDTALQKDEYADFEAGKIYRMSGGTLTPTDPPVALPTLPTVEGETIVDYAGAKTETTKNILPSAQAQTLTVNGNTCTCDGQGRYHVDMNNNTDTNFVFSIPDFTIPISVGQGGNGTWSMFNTAAQSMQVKLYYNDTEIDYWSISDTNRASDSYVSMGGKTINKIIINAWNASVDGDFAFMFTDDGVLPAEFVPHEVAKPTPEKVLLKYKKG